MLRLILLMFVLLAAMACSDKQVQQPAFRGLVDGDYWLVSMIESHTLERVHLTVINNFECRACAGLESKITVLQNRYGDRVAIDYYDVITPKTKLGVIAHYLLKNGHQGRELRNYLYTHFSKINPPDADVLDFWGQFGLDQNDFNNPAIIYEVERRDRIARRLAEGTPTIIIEGHLAMQGDIGKISHIIDQLLVNGKKE